MPEPKSEVLPITPWGITALTIVPQHVAGAVLFDSLLDELQTLTLCGERLPTG